MATSAYAELARRRGETRHNRCRDREVFTPSIAALHPEIVHFAVTLFVVGVLFRLFSLTGRVAFTSPAATTLILLGTLASVAAVSSGDQAHGPAERVPGACAAVVAHEEWGLRARDAFIIISVFELVALGLTSMKNTYARLATMITAGAGWAG